MAKQSDKKDQKNEGGEVYRHDTFFRKVFSESENAQSFLQSFLPETLASKIDFSSLQLESTGYVSKNLESYYSDLIWSARYDGHAVKIAFLLEHKSFVPRFPHVQLLRYMAEGYERQIKNDNKLAVILPIVLYHGKRKWPFKRFEAYFKGISDELRQYVPNFQYRLVDLNQYAYEDLIRLPLRKAVPGIWP